MPMPYSVIDDIKLIQIQDRIDKLLVLLKDQLQDASPSQITHIKRELNQLVAQRLNEIKKQPWHIRRCISTNAYPRSHIPVRGICQYPKYFYYPIPIYSFPYPQAHIHAHMCGWKGMHEDCISPEVIRIDKRKLFLPKDIR
jgi:hypothetical protein